MVIFPVIALIVSVVFATMLLLRYAHTKRLPLLAWGIALGMYALASLAVAAGSAGGWDPTLFRMYWLFGALLNVPYLALGSVALLQNRLLTGLMVVVVAAGTLFAFGAVVSAGTHAAAFEPDAKQIPRGSEVWGKGELLHNMGSWYSIPAYLLVVGVAAASSRKRTTQQNPSRARANWLIAGGATIVATGSSLARYGRGAAFSVALALGVVVMFIGFVMTSRGAKPEAKT